MKEPDMERVATGHGPESCGGAREGAAEALTGGSAGQPLSSEITSPGRRPCVMKGKARRRVALTASHVVGPAESETLSMRGHFMTGGGSMIMRRKRFRNKSDSPFDGPVRVPVHGQDRTVGELVEPLAAAPAIRRVVDQAAHDRVFVAIVELVGMVQRGSCVFDV